MTSRTAEPGSRSVSTAMAIRDFIRSGGRILVTPGGELTEGGGVPWPFIDGSDEDVAECLRAGRAYLSACDLLGAERRISRTVRKVGRRTDHGWFVLEADAKRKRGAH